MAFGELNIEGLALVREGARLIGPVDLRLESPGITAIMGANGSGKSLFLHLIHGLIAPSSGRVLWDLHAATATRARRGFVFQNCPVMRRSVAQNVGFPLQAAGIGGTARRTRVARALEAARLSDKADLPAASLSGGERQRMALARALVMEPDVILLDEPAASLDPASTKALEAMVVESAARGVKILIATHDIAQARRLAGDILFFDGGQIVEIAAAKAFFNAPASEAGQNYLKGLL